jgi:hypothetical protein
VWTIISPFLPASLIVTAGALPLPAPSLFLRKEELYLWLGCARKYTDEATQEWSSPPGPHSTS